MIKPFYRLIIFLVWSISACTTTPIVWDGSVNDQVDKWLAEEQYGRALDAIRNITQQHKEFEKVKSKENEAQTKAQKYEERVISSIRDARNKNDWKTIYAIYKEIEWKYPKSTRLQKEIFETNKIHEAEQSKILLQRRYARADWLNKEITYQRQYLKTTPGETLEEWNLDMLIDESKTLAIDLAKDGDNAMAAKAYNEAKEAYNYSYNLSPTPEVKKQLDYLKKRDQQRLNAIKKKETAKKKKAINTREQVLSKLYKSALAKNQLIKAQKAAIDLVKLKPDVDSYQDNLNHINLLIKSYAQSSYNKGAMLYSKGDFNGAIKEWETALKYEPEHEASKISLDRAKRVIEKLNTIKQQQ